MSVEKKILDLNMFQNLSMTSFLRNSRKIKQADKFLGNKLIQYQKVTTALLVFFF